jgi:hypothetical protein
VSKGLDDYHTAREQLIKYGAQLRVCVFGPMEDALVRLTVEAAAAHSALVAHARMRKDVVEKVAEVRERRAALVHDTHAAQANAVRRWCDSVCVCVWDCDCGK